MNGTKQPVAIVKVPDGLWAWDLTSAARKQGSSTWFEVSEAFADHALNVLPPRYFAGGFCVSEPIDDDERGVTIYLAIVTIDGKAYARELPSDKCESEARALHNALGAFPPLEPTEVEKHTTTVVGTYRAVNGPGLLDIWLPIFGIREWKFGPQVLVKAVGGRAWINVPSRDIRRNGEAR